ncbi:CD109 antigen-like [Chironomus tepperi]|uniref:CD109 antigen-like n=1 Tax=Chironomus tepperi TaxID=113505 RepID=UPI00391EE768
MTLHRNETIDDEQRQMCMTKTLRNIEVDKKNFYAFIQTDKPIYFPGDTVRFRVVIVDRDLKPYAINNMEISIIDSLNRTIELYDDPGENYVGVFKENFILSQNTELGTWKIRVVVDKRYESSTYKTFSVQKFNPPSLIAHLNLADQHMLHTSVLRVSFYAENQVGDFVQGNAQLTIKCTTTGETIITESFNNTADIQHVEYKVNANLNATAGVKLDYEVSLEFTELESQEKSLKTATFTVHPDFKFKIRANHPDKFLPEFPFNLDVFIYDWKDSIVENSTDTVKIVYTTRYQDGTEHSFTYDALISNGIVQNSFFDPEDAHELSFKIYYNDVTYEKSVLKGSTSAGVTKIAVDHVPKNPQYGANVTVFVRAASEIDNLIAIVTSRHGNTESYQISCNFGLSCNFNFAMKKEMMPESKVTVYQIQNKYNMIQGETTIKTENFGINKLDVDFVKTSGINKRYNIGNDITNDEIRRELTNYDEKNMITMMDMKKSNWNECTDQELKRIQKGRLHVIQHSYDYLPFGTDDDDDDEVVDSKEEQQEEIVKDELPERQIDEIHENYFSMNQEYGLAIAPQKELIIKNQFYSKLSMPYSIKYGEIFRIDVMFYNNIDKEL